MRRVEWLMLTGVVLGGIAAASAQDVSSALATCRAEKNENARLACYDRLADDVAPTGNGATAPAAADGAGDSSVTPAAAGGSASAPADAPAPKQDFGYRGGALARADAAREEETRAEDTDQAQGVTGTVTEVTRRARGELVVTLDNGQTWVQKAADGKFVVKFGDKVRVESGTLGSYTMYRADSRRGTRVTRVR